jgi:hypothetical protein
LTPTSEKAIKEKIDFVRHFAEAGWALKYNSQLHLKDKQHQPANTAWPLE